MDHWDPEYPLRVKQGLNNGLVVSHSKYYKPKT